MPTEEIDARGERRAAPGEGEDMTMTMNGRPRAAADETGAVAHLSAGGWGRYHRRDCPDAPRRGDAGIRDVVRGPWRYLAAHWAPCPRCRPPAPT
jgi:hypothetical protein